MRVRPALDLLQLAWMNAARRPTRSSLTVIGIAVGMTAVVGLLSLSGGAQLALTRQFARLGHDLVLVLPGGAGGLSPEGTMALDLEALDSLTGAAQAGALLRRTLPVKTEDVQGFLAVLGLSPATWEAGERFFHHFALTEGALPAGGDELVLTAGAAADLGLSVGDPLTVAGRAFRVSGQLAPTGDPEAEGAILLPLQTLWGLTEGREVVSLAWVRARPGVEVDALASAVEALLGATGQRFQVQTSKRLSEVVGTVLRVLFTAFTGVAAVALLVGGLGLANTMYTAVSERTREIGIFVSLGARRGQVLALYLMESGLLGLVGGGLGVLFGVALAESIAALIGGAADLPSFRPAVDAPLVVLSLLLSVGLGMISGLLPARRAAALSPVEALRHE